MPLIQPASVLLSDHAAISAGSRAATPKAPICAQAWAAHNAITPRLPRRPLLAARSTATSTGTTSGLVVDPGRQHLAHEVGVQERVVVDRLGELTLLLELGLGEPEEAHGEVVEHHLELQLGHELLHQRRVEVLEEVRH